MGDTDTRQITQVKPHDPRCSDFDHDCADVVCHISCWLGGVRGDYYTPPADGYCPYLRSESKEQ